MLQLARLAPRVCTLVLFIITGSTRGSRTLCKCIVYRLHGQAMYLLYSIGVKFLWRCALHFTRVQENTLKAFRTWTTHDFKHKIWFNVHYISKGDSHCPGEVGGPERRWVWGYWVARLHSSPPPPSLSSPPHRDTPQAHHSHTPAHVKTTATGNNIPFCGETISIGDSRRKKLPGGPNIYVGTSK